MQNDLESFFASHRITKWLFHFMRFSYLSLVCSASVAFCFGYFNLNCVVQHRDRYTKNNNRVSIAIQCCIRLSWLFHIFSVTCNKTENNHNHEIFLYDILSASRIMKDITHDTLNVFSVFLLRLPASNSIARFHSPLPNNNKKCDQICETHHFLSLYFYFDYIFFSSLRILHNLPQSFI